MSRFRRLFGWPIRTSVDPRLARVSQEIPQRTVEAIAQLVRTEVHGIDERLDIRFAESFTWVQTATGGLQSDLRAIDQRIDSRLAELRSWVEETVGGRFEDRVGISEMLMSLHRALLQLHDDLDQLSSADGTASGRALDPHGPVGRAGLWLTPTVQVEIGRGEARLTDITERIVETPYVLGRISDLAAPATVLDLGGSSSTLGLSLAALGHRVTVIDPLGYPFSHPNLQVIALGYEQAGPDATGFDAAIALSSIQHFGLDYGGPGEDPHDSDRRAMTWLHDRVLPGGTLLLTLPMAETARQEGARRVYDASSVRALLDGWEIIDFSAAWATGGHDWELGPADAPASGRGVALVTAHRTDS